MDQDIKKKVEDLLEGTKPKELTPQEEQEMQDGFALQEMTGTAGWKVLKGWIEALGFHSWVDPRQTKSKEEWDWQELNAFHASNNAKELLNSIETIISRAQYLHKVKLGEITNRKMRI